MAADAPPASDQRQQLYAEGSGLLESDIDLFHSAFLQEVTHTWSESEIRDVFTNPALFETITSYADRQKDVFTFSEDFVLTLADYRPDLVQRWLSHPPYLPDVDPILAEHAGSPAPKWATSAQAVEKLIRVAPDEFTLMVRRDVNAWGANFYNPVMRNYADVVAAGMGTTPSMGDVTNSDAKSFLPATLQHNLPAIFSHSPASVYQYLHLAHPSIHIVPTAAVEENAATATQAAFLLSLLDLPPSKFSTSTKTSPIPVILSKDGRAYTTNGTSIGEVNLVTLTETLTTTRTLPDSLTEHVFHPGDPLAGPDLSHVMETSPESCLDPTVWAVTSHLQPAKLLQHAGATLAEHHPDGFTYLVGLHPEIAAEHWPTLALASDTHNHFTRWVDGAVRSGSTTPPPALVVAMVAHNPDLLTGWVADATSGDHPGVQEDVRLRNESDVAFSLWGGTRPAVSEWIFNPNVAGVLAENSPSEFAHAVAVAINDPHYRRQNVTPSPIAHCPEVAAATTPDAVLAWATTQMKQFGRFSPTARAHRNQLKDLRKTVGSNRGTAHTIEAAKIAREINTLTELYATLLSDPLTLPFSPQLWDTEAGYLNQISTVLAELINDPAVQGSCIDGISMGAWSPEDLTRVAGITRRGEVVTAAMIAGSAVHLTGQEKVDLSNPERVATHVRAVSSQVAVLVANKRIPESVGDAFISSATKVVKTATLAASADSGEASAAFAHAQQGFTQLSHMWATMVGSHVTTNAPELQKNLTDVLGVTGSPRAVTLRARITGQTHGKAITY